MTTYTYTTIDPPGSTYSVAESINNKGQIVGFYQNSSGQEFGFLDSGGKYTTIDFPGSIQTTPTAINAKGQIVGTYADSNSVSHAFLYSGGTYTTLDVPGARLYRPLKHQRQRTDHRDLHRQ